MGNEGSGERKRSTVEAAKEQAAEAPPANPEPPEAEVAPQAVATPEPSPQESVQLAEVRSRLGLEKGADTESMEHDRALRQSATEMRDSLESFAAEMQQRSKAGLDPFTDRQTYSSLRGGIGQLTDFIENRALNKPGDMREALASVHRGLTAMKEQAGKGPLRENGESLARLATSSQSFYESLGTLYKRTQPGDEEFSNTLRLARTRAEELSSFFNRKRQALRDYQRG